MYCSAFKVPKLSEWPDNKQVKSIVPAWAINTGKSEVSLRLYTSCKAKCNGKILWVKENIFINHVLSSRGASVMYSRLCIVTLLEDLLSIYCK